MIFTVHIDVLMLTLVAAHFTLFGVWCGIVWADRRVRKYMDAANARLASEEDLLRRTVVLQELEQRARSAGWYDQH